MSVCEEAWEHVQHKVTYCCDQRLSFFTAEVYEAVDAGIKASIEHERERIIKLLEENHSWAWQHDPVSQDSCASCESIALIKGENK